MTFSIRNNTIKIEKSHHGSGVFANANFEAGDYLGTIIKKISHTNTPEDYFRTAMGRYIKHSKNPNTNIVALKNDRYGLTANNNISNGEELFINYEVMAKIIGFPFKPLSKQADSGALADAWKQHPSLLNFIPNQKTKPPGFQEEYNFEKNKQFKWKIIGIGENIQGIEIPVSMAKELEDVMINGGFGGLLGEEIEKDGKLFNKVNSYVIEYSHGKNTNRQVRLGRAIQKLIRFFPEQKGFLEKIKHINEISPKSKYVVVVSAEPADLRTISTNRGWTSCMNWETNSDASGATESSVNSRDLVAYASDLKGNWLARCVLRFDGKNGWWPDKIYGQPSSVDFDQFMTVVENWLKKEGIYGKDRLVSPFFEGWTDYGNPTLTKEEYPIEGVPEKDIPETEYPEKYKGTGYVFSPQKDENLKIYFTPPSSHDDRKRRSAYLSSLFSQEYYSNLLKFVRIETNEPEFPAIFKIINTNPIFYNALLHDPSVERVVKASLSKQAGLFQPPPEMVKLIWEWVLPRYASLVFRKTKDISLKEKAGKDCDFNPFDYQDYKTTIPISLEGWKYEVLQTEEWKGIWDDVKVEMFKAPEPEYVGQYDDKDNTIRIVLDEQWLNPSPNNYEMLKNTILRNIEHEVIHLGQYIFKHFKNLEFGGMPSKSISDPAYDPEGFSNMAPDPETGENYLPSKDHPLREIEFYALLNDAKIELKRQIERWPNMEDVIFQRYVGIIPSYNTSIPQEFFLKLKEQEPEKWQKAVKELYKTIDKFDLSKRAAEKILYEIKLQPSENQLEHFLKQEGVWFNPLKDRPNPDYLQEKNSYFIGVEKAFKYALEEFKALSFILGFTIITEKLNYRTRGENIYPSKIIIEADPYTAAQLKTHPVIRGLKEKETTINEVYV